MFSFGLYRWIFRFYLTRLVDDISNGSSFELSLVNSSRNSCRFFVSTTMPLVNEWIVRPRFRQLKSKKKIENCRRNESFRFTKSNRFRRWCKWNRPFHRFLLHVDQSVVTVFFEWLSFVDWRCCSFWNERERNENLRKQWRKRKNVSTVVRTLHFD